MLLPSKDIKEEGYDVIILLVYKSVANRSRNSIAIDLFVA